MENISNLISNNSSAENDGLAFFLAYIPDYLPNMILVSIGIVFGVIGNLIIMLTIITNKELHSPTFMLIFNLSMADMLISGFVDSSTIFSVFIGEKYFTNRQALCSFIGIICFVGCSTSVINLGFLSFNRYIHICHHNLYKKVFTKKLTLLYCAITWLFGIVNNMTNFTGWSSYKYDKETLSCVWDRLASLSYNLYLAISCIVIPCVAICFFYTRIFLFSYKSKNKSSSSSVNKSIRLAKGLFASFILYAICWLPFGIVVMTDFNIKLPRSFVMFSMVLGHLNSSLNPILYAVFNTAFRCGCAKFFNKICCASFNNIMGNDSWKQSSANSLTKRANINNTLNTL